MNRTKIILTCITACVIAVASLMYGIRTYNMYLMVVPALLPLFVAGVSKLEWVFAVAIGAMYSKLVFPGFPGELELFHLFLVFLGGMLVIRRLITKERFMQDPVVRFAAILYAGVAFYTMLARGIGFRVLGGGQAGGMRYVLIFIGTLVVCYVPNIHMPKRMLRKALIVSALLSFLPVLAEGILLASGGRIFRHYYFLQPGFGLGMALMNQNQGNEVRFMSAAILGGGLVYFPFFVFPFTRKHAALYTGMILLGLGLGALSGFRSILVFNVIFLFIFGYLMFDKKRKMYILTWLGGGAIGYLFLFLVFRFLPFGIQRSLSFIPFLPSDAVVMMDANSTLDFRLGVWNLAIQEIPHYLLLGRGLTFDLNELTAIESSFWMSDQQSVSGLIANLHNGPLEVLLYLGIPGVLFFVLFMSRSAYVAVRDLRQSVEVEESRRLIAFFTSLLLATGALFLITVGNPYSTYLNVCIYLALIRILHAQALGKSSTNSPKPTVP